MELGWMELAWSTRNSDRTNSYTWVCLKIVYPYTQWLMIIIPIKWLSLGIYPIFRQTHIHDLMIQAGLRQSHRIG